jgi:hypothetical protein
MPSRRASRAPTEYQHQVRSATSRISRGAATRSCCSYSVWQTSIKRQQQLPGCTVERAQQPCEARACGRSRYGELPQDSPTASVIRKWLLKATSGEGYDEPGERRSSEFTHRWMRGFFKSTILQRGKLLHGLNIEVPEIDSVLLNAHVHFSH